MNIFDVLFQSLLCEDDEYNLMGNCEPCLGLCVSGRGTMKECAMHCPKRYCEMCTDQTSNNSDCSYVNLASCPGKSIQYIAYVQANVTVNDTWGVSIFSAHLHH